MSARRPIRWGRGLLLALLLLILAAATVLLWLLVGARARMDGRVHATGLSDAVQIARDDRGTVTIEAANRLDVDYALGFVHAQERYFAMDLMRRVAAGELSELVGKAALDVDTAHRMHRLRAVARAAYGALPPEQRQALDRYRDGVNAGLRNLAVRPWEYLLLGRRPRPWSSEDSFLVIAAMYLDLQDDGRNRHERRLDALYDVLPGALADFLTAPDPDWEAPLDGQLSRPPVLPGPEVFDLRNAPPAPAPLAAAFGDLHQVRRAGSNSFAVAGNLTGDGAAMLANDMHLGLRVPNIWFRVRLRYADPTAPSGRRDASGVSLPGTPALVVGSNGQIAWGFTNSYGDYADWVRVVRDPAHPERYKVPEGWATIERHDEHIRVKGAPDRTITVESTRWGPILEHAADGTPLALAWIGDRPHAYNFNLGQLEHAADTVAALNLAPTLGIPPQNLLVADRAGHIGWTVAGNAIPLRADADDPRRPADWSMSGHGWQGWAAAAQYPRVLDPVDGRLWTANNRVVGGDALELLGNGGYALGARAQQIRDDLRTRSQFTPGALLDVQLDNRALLLTRWQRLLQDTLSGTQDDRLAELRDLTAAWRNRAAVDGVDYRLVRAFRDAVHEAVLAPFVARVAQKHPDFAWPGLGDPEAAVWAMLRDQPPNLLDPKYRDWRALLLDAARGVARDLGSQPGGLAARTWGEVNRAGIRHPLSSAVPGLGALLDMPDEPLPGDNDMPRVARPGFGASERLDVSPGREAEGILEMPAGQSDNPLSPYYGAGHADWVNGVPTPLLPGPTRYTLTLTPR